MSALLAPLQYDFMIKALISAAAVGGGQAPLLA